MCLTVVNIKDNDLSFDVSAETLSCTQFGALTQGDMVNIEPAMRGSERIGGHLITGHVDTLGKVVDSKNIDGSLRMPFRCHHSFAGLVAKKAVEHKVNYLAFGSFFKSRLKPQAKKAHFKIFKQVK